MNKRTLLHAAVIMIAFFICYGIVELLKFPMPVGIAAVVLYFLAIAAFNYKTLIFYAANVSHARGNSELAIRIFQRLIKMNPKNPRAYMNYAILLLRDNRAEEALPLLEIAKTKNLDMIDEKNVYVSFGSCYWLLGETDKAIEVLEFMRKKFDYVNHYALSTLGYMYFLKGDTDKALEITELALLDKADASSAWDNKGQIYYSLGDVAEAKQHFLKAIECKADLVDSLYYLGLISESEDDLRAARSYYDRAAKCVITAFNTISREEALKKAEEVDQRIRQALLAEEDDDDDDDDDDENE